MLNPRDANSELHCRLRDILLAVKFANVLTQEDLKTLCYATGVHVDFDRTETRLQRLRRMAQEAEQATLRG